MGQPSKQQLDIRVGGCSKAGVKAENQDAFAAYQPGVQGARYKGVGVCVADGVSCSENASQASTLSVTHFLQDYYSTPESWDVKSAASKVLSSLNAWLFHHSLQGGVKQDGLITTFTAVVVKSATAHIFHVGDSRLLHISGSSVEQVTRDHVQPQTGHLTRALGMDSHLEVDYRQRDVRIGDLLLLASDGFYRFVSLPELTASLEQLEFPASQRVLEQWCQQWVAAAEGNGSDDNITCVLLQVVDLPAPEIEEVARQNANRVIPPVLEIGQKLDQYQVLDVLHSNSRSHVYKVRNTLNDEIGVLKAPSINFEDDEQYLEAFGRELWVGRRLDHPNLMKMAPQNDRSQFLYQVCEYLDGANLRQWMHDHPNPELPMVREIIMQVIAGLRAMQRKGMVHRDIKPENIIIGHDGRVRIIDFGAVSVKGLAELGSGKREERPEGDVGYISPEYVMDGIAVTASDQFSLAVMVYEMLAGCLPYDMAQVIRRGAKSTGEWHYRSLREARPDLPLWLDLAIKKACHPKLEQRYESFSEFAADLQAPNQALLKLHTRKPLMEQAPTQFWMLLSLLLGMMSLAQWWWILR